MKSLTTRMRTMLPGLDKDFLIWGVLPALAASLITALFVVPNYMRALSLNEEAQRLQAVADENMNQKKNLERLEASIAALRDQRQMHCKPLCKSVGQDRLPTVIARQDAEAGVRDQSIHTGIVALVEDPSIELKVAKREITVEMTATFNAIFGVIDSADSIDQLVTTKSIDIYAMTLAPEQALQGNPMVHAIIVFEEWFEATAARSAPVGERNNGAAGAAIPAHAGTQTVVKSSGTALSGAYDAAKATETAKASLGR